MSDEDEEWISLMYQATASVFTHEQAAEREAAMQSMLSRLRRGRKCEEVLPECINLLKAWTQENYCDCTMEGGVHTCGLPHLFHIIEKAELAIHEAPDVQ